MNKETKSKVKKLLSTLKESIELNDPELNKEEAGEMVYYIRCGVRQGIELAMEAIADEFDAEEILGEYGDFD